MINRLFIWFLLIVIGQFPLSNAQVDTQIYSGLTDSLKSIQIRNIILDGNAFLAKQKYDSAIITYSFADSLALEIESDRLRASSKHNIGLCYYRMGEYLECKAFFEDAIDLSESIGDEIKKARYQMSIGVLYKKQGMIDLSMKHIMKSLYIAEKHKEKELLITAYNTVAGIQKSLGNYNEAINYYNAAMVILKENENQDGMASVFNNIGNVLQVMDSLKLSKVYLHKSLVIKQKIKDKRLIITSLKNLGKNCFLLGQLDSAQYYYLRALKMSKQISHSEKIVSCLNALGEVKIKAKQYDSAFNYLESARVIAIDYNMRKLLLDNYKFSKDLFNVTKQYKKAFQFSDLYTMLNSELYDVEKTKGMNELRFQYETDKKDHEIISLNQVNELKNRNFILISIALSIILILTIGLFIAYRQKKNAYAHIQLLMHEGQHRTKNNLQLLSSILSLQSGQVRAEHREAVMSAEFRVQSIVLLNKQLDIEDTKGRILLSDYFKNLIDGLVDAYITDDHIDFITDFVNISVLPHQATHLGLIANELITNSLKYAFKDVLKPIINMECLLLDKDTCKLIISDNGNGLPVNWKMKAESSLGLNLVEDLANQLKGKFLLENRKGFYFQLIFPIK